MDMVRVVTRSDRIVDEVTVIDTEKRISNSGEKIPLNCIGVALPVEWDCRDLLREYADLSTILERGQKVAKDDVEYHQAMKVVLNRVIPSIRNHVRTHPLNFMLAEDFSLPHVHVDKQAMLNMFNMAYKYDLKEAWRFLAQSAYRGIDVRGLDDSLSDGENRAYYVQQVAGIRHEKYDVDGDGRADLIGSILKNTQVTNMNLADVTVLAMSLASMSVAVVI